MATRPIKRFIDVDIEKGTPSVSAANFSDLLVITDSESLSTSERTKSFSTAASVELFFGENSEEALYADAFFNQDSALENQPDTLIFGFFDNPNETFATALTAIEADNNGWYAMGALKQFRDITVTRDMADQIESRRKIFLVATNDANTLVSGDTTTFAYYLKNANYKRTACIYHDQAALYPDASWLGQQLPKDVGSTNWAYKTLAGIAEGATADIPSVSLTEDQKTNALNVNCNVYTTTLASDFTYFGIMGGGKNADKEGEYIDIVRNVDFLQARIEEGLMSLLLEKDIIPYTNGGITIVDNRLISLLDTYGVKQGILVDGSVETSFPKRSEVSQLDRDDRLLPDGTFTAELAGGINTVVIRGTVSI